MHIKIHAYHPACVAANSESYRPTSAAPLAKMATLLQTIRVFVFRVGALLREHLTFNMKTLFGSVLIKSLAHERPKIIIPQFIYHVRSSSEVHSRPRVLSEESVAFPSALCTIH